MPPRGMCLALLTYWLGIGGSKWNEAREAGDEEAERREVARAAF